MRSSLAYSRRTTSHTWLRSVLVLAGLALGLAAGERGAAASTTTWDGGGDGFNWSSANNWNPNGVPGTNDDVVINSGTVTIDVNTAVLRSFTINGGTVTQGSANQSINVVGAGQNTLVVTGGTFIGANGIISVDGDVTISGSANFTSTSGTVTLIGNFSKTGTGTFNANGGTFTFTKSGTITNNGSFAALNISGNGVYALGSALTTTGLLTVTRGTLDTSASNYSVTAAGLTLSAGTYNGHSNTTIVNGDLSISGGSFLASTSSTSISGSFNHTGGTFTASGGTVTMTGAGTITSGGSSFGTLTVAASGTYTLADALSVANTFTVSSGTLASGTAAITASGDLTVQGPGTLTLAGSTVSMGSAKTLTIDGTLNASAGTIKSAAGTYAFKVGSTSTARPTLNISGLAVQNTDANGMSINSASGAVTTFTRFDNIAFSNGATGTGSQYLQITANSLYLTSNGVSFGVGNTSLPAVAVSLTGNGTSDGETRAIFASATCATSKTDSTTSLCDPTWKSDDDADLNGVPTSPGSHGASVIQFSRAAETDTAGSIEGVPTAAFDWNTYAYYSTYAAFHDVSGTADRVYVRSATGAAKYSWDTGSGEQIVGTPKWGTIGTTHYVYVTVNGSTADSAKIYRLKDDGSSLALDASGNWSGRNPFGCSCTVTTPPALDTSNLYWGGSTGGASRVWRLAVALAAASPYGLSNVPITPTVTTTGPALTTIGSTTYMLMGVVGSVLKVDVTNMALLQTNTSPGSSSVYGRIALAGTAIYAGDDGGRMWAIDFNNFTGTNNLWSYTVSGDSIKSSAFYDYTGNVLMFGTEAGKVVALTSAGAAVTGYPYTPGATSDKIQSALMYRSGVLVVGTTTGKLFFLDRNNGTTGPALIRQYDFGPTENVSGISFDVVTSRYMVTTSDPSTSDGRLYYFDLIADPTSGTP